MDNSIYDYIKNGITIKGNPLDGYEVFTIPTQHFKMDSLHQLTPETFENAIQKQKEHDELTSEIFKEVQKEIDQEILNQLRGGEPNPDIIPWRDYIDGKYDTPLDVLFNKFMNTSEGDPDLIWNKEQFHHMLLNDDEFYKRWGDNCCEELTEEERYNIWFNNNYETGMERYFDPNNLPDYDNDYYEPTPKRKSKWN
jgi:hypothetical protein